MKCRPLIAIALLVVSGAAPNADEAMRTLVVRERATASLLDDSFTFRVMKLRGYSIDIMLRGEKLTLKLGDAFSPDHGACTVVFRKISPETRIARFQTDCR